MLPRLSTEPALDRVYREFLRAIRAAGFGGDILSDYGSRLVHATDNSVYQIVPQAVVCPRAHADVVTLARVAAEPRFSSVVLSPRGGGTGTNGQSLTDGIAVDLARHMSRILELDLEHGWVRVQPGVVLDQLNAFLRPHGLFFPANVSPSNRATLGGMISTDACGKGSRIYGRTSNHVLELELVLIDGTVWRSRRADLDELEALRARRDRIGEIVRTVDDIVTAKRALIDAQFPKMPRFLTGYNLAHVRRDAASFDLNPIVSGAEGTLAFVTEARLAVKKLPAHKRLIALRYATFDDALASAGLLVGSDPGAIETIDDRILGLARADPVWHRIGHLLEDRSGEHTAALNLVEYEGDDAAAVEAKVKDLVAALEARRGEPGQAMGFVLAKDARESAGLWELRKKGVGLLGATPGDRRPVAFVEDTAVPPERLAEYVREFRALLDAAGLSYGMFGHVDVGCLHVRPALDLRNPGDEVTLRKISDRVVELVKSYGGVMWSEHGKGFRSEYSPRFFGDELFGDLCKIKRAFDPHNQLNPGKLAVAAGTSARMASVDAPKRGAFDRSILPASRARFAVAVHCNGNAACFDYSAESVMCPSARVTRDRIHSPKGRAAMMREWLRQLAVVGYDAAAVEVSRPSLDALFSGAASRARGEYDFSHEVYSAMNGCLSCKACATQCPIKVDVPEFKAEFLAHYHGRYPRPLKDHFVAMLENVLVWLGRIPRLANAVLRAHWFESLMRRVVGIVDTPLLSELSLRTGLRRRGARILSPEALCALPAAERAQGVILVQDAFTTFYESHVALAVFDLLRELDYRPYVLDYSPNGKALHVKGFLARFRRTAHRSLELLEAASRSGMPLVGVDPAVTLTYRDEYPKALPGSPRVEVLLLQEWLNRQSARIGEAIAERRRLRKEQPAYRLLGHCTERTAEPGSQALWQRAFELFGLRLQLEPVGCCGMCGVYGHEAEHLDESRGIYAMSWQQRLPDGDDRRLYLAAGHSCRSQVYRFDGVVLQHPAEALLDALRAASIEGAQRPRSQ